VDGVAAAAAARVTLSAPRRTAPGGTAPGPAAPASGPWLLSPRADYWLIAAGGLWLPVAMALGLRWWGDRELDTVDLVLSELHLGATYEAVVRRRLWRRMPWDGVAVPLAILAATYVLMLRDGSLWVTTTILYLGAWHRARQSLGIARAYQRRVGGPLSAAHRRLLQAAFYAPLAAGVAYYASTAPAHEGEPFLGLTVDDGILAALGGLAVLAVLAHLAWTGSRPVPPATADGATGSARRGVHPAERWLVVANALAFGSAYVIGAWTTAYVLVLAVYHEIQYLAFTYALARRAGGATEGARREAARLGRFAAWPLVNLASWAACTWSGLSALAPFLTAGLLVHYWLDGRIWRTRSDPRLAG
jgi:hypothetical protein